MPELRVYENDDITLLLQFRKKDKTAYDLGTMAVEFAVKDSLDAAANKFLYTRANGKIVISAPASGDARVEMLGSEITPAGNYIYRVAIFPNGRRLTVDQDKFIIKDT